MPYTHTLPDFQHALDSWEAEGNVQMLLEAAGWALHSMAADANRRSLQIQAHPEMAMQIKARYTQWYFEERMAYELENELENPEQHPGMGCAEDYPAEAEWDSTAFSDASFESNLRTWRTP